MSRNRLGVAVLCVAISIISGAAAATAGDHDHTGQSTTATLAGLYLAIQEALAGDFAPTDGLKVAYCPMADKHWLQPGDRIANPYYGASMLRCGGFVEQPGTIATSSGKQRANSQEGQDLPWEEG